MGFIKDFLTATVFGPAFFAGWIFEIMAGGFKFGREMCEAAMNRRVDEIVKGE